MVYLADSDNVDLDADERFRVASNGKIGIGTAEPAAKLHVQENDASPTIYLRRQDSSNPTGLESLGTLDFTLDNGNIHPYYVRARIESYSMGDGSGEPSHKPRTDLLFHTTSSFGDLTEKMRITGEGNLGIGTTNPGGGTGSSILSLSNTSAAPTAQANTTHLYSSSGEGYWMDAAGNATLQTPHDPETGEWIFYSKNVKTGKVLRVDMEKLARFIDEKFNTDFVKEFTADEFQEKSRANF